MVPILKRDAPQSARQVGEAPSIGIYMPRVQFGIRLTLALMSGIYFLALPVPPLLLNLAGIGAVVVLFLVFHLVWWRWFLTRGMGDRGIRLAAVVDVAAGLTAVLVDPFEVPPTGLLLLIAVLGNGMQHGFRVFLEQSLAILLAGIPVFAVRQILFFGPLSYQLIFVHLFMAVCIYYVYVLLKRIERMKKQAEELARQDPLTKLYNRNTFIQSVSCLLSLHERQRMPLVAMFADLDDFKSVNDTLGHAFGDAVLQFFSRLTRELLRKSDIVARYGGDEFVFMLTDMTVEEAEQVALRLRRELARWAEERDVKVGVSFGIAAVPEGRVDLDRLLRHADQALYEAKTNKERGGGIVVAPVLIP